jgi:mono/diheme cytochrome c family protein
MEDVSLLQEHPMKVLTCLGLAAAIAAAAAAPVLAQSTPENSATPDTAPKASAPTPTGVTPDLIAQGDKIFHGPGNCYACHGSNGEGLVGPNLTDAEWIHSKGSYEEIVAQVMHGVSKEESKSGIPMPPKGGGTISDDDVKAVAAYVYSLSHK